MLTLFEHPRRRRVRKRPRRVWLRLMVLLLLIIGLSRGAAHGSELEETNADLAAQLHLKVLAYDRNLNARSGGRLVLAIVYRPDHDDSERIRGLMQTAFQERARKSNIQGLPLLVTSVIFDAKTMTKRLQDVGATIVYVTPGLEDGVGTISAAAQTLKAPTLTGRRGLLDAGIAIAVVTKDDRPGLVINLPVAKALGMDLDPGVLRLAEVKK